jgi:hypothetical protein
LTADFGGTFAYTGSTDQPWIQVGPVDPDTGLDRVYLSVNDLCHPQSTPSIVVSTDGGVTFQQPLIPRDGGGGASRNRLAALGGPGPGG